MIDDIGNIGLFKRFIQNELSEQEVVDFNIQLENNEAFKASFDEFKSIYFLFMEEDIIATNKLFEEVRGDYKEKIFRRKLIIGASVFVFALIGAIWYFNSTKEIKNEEATVVVLQEEEKISKPQHPVVLTEEELAKEKQLISPITKENSKGKFAVPSIDVDTSLLNTVISSNGKDKSEFPLNHQLDSSKNKTIDVKNPHDSQLISRKKVLPCDTVQINIQTKNICLGEEKGQIIIEEVTPIVTTSLKGYTLSSNLLSYDNLSSRQYTLVINYANGCSKEYLTQLTEDWCIEKNVKLSYNQEAFWLIQAPSSGKVYVYNRAGSIMSTFDIGTDEYTFRGEKFDGNRLPTGNYSYVIELSSGLVKKGILSVYP